MKHRKIKNGNMKGEQLEDRIRRFSVCVCVCVCRHAHTYIFSRRDQNVEEAIFKEIVAENFLELIKCLYSPIKEPSP